MASPFDYAKALTSSKEDLYTTEDIFQKEYLPFMVNKILSNSPQTALFADMMNQYQHLDKKMQYDFYMIGVPKQRASKMWTKKEESEIPLPHLEYIAEKLHVSMTRAIELYPLIGSDVIIEAIGSKGGRM
jgi:hypothetical protein